MDRFFHTNQIYIVAGASTNPDKFGYKVLKWYRDHKLDVVPLNPKQEVILGVQSVADIKDILSEGTEQVAVSFVTPPDISEDILKSIAESDTGRVKSVWFQPGTTNNRVVELANKIVPNVIEDCILVNGQRYLSKL